VKLACGRMLPVVAGAFSHEMERKLKCIGAGKTPCGVGTVNGHKIKVMRDTGSTTCVVKRSLVDAVQMTGNHELCMLIDGVVKRFPTAFVRINTPYYKGTVKALCMENPVQELIVGNVPGAVGVEACDEVEVTELSEVVSDRHEVECETQPKQVLVEDETNEKMSEIESVVNTKESSEMKRAVIADEENHCAAVQTRAMKVKEGKRQRPLKVITVSGLDIGPEQLVEQQKADKTLKKYWELVENLSESEVSKDDNRIAQVAAIACVIDDGINGSHVARRLHKTTR